LFIEHGLQLEPQALFRFVQTFQKLQADLVYTDGVLTGAGGEQVEELICRPAFSPELLRSHQYIDHLAGYDRQFLETLGEPPIAAPRLQQYELLLRAAEKGASTAHIPQFLYRVTQGESAEADGERGADEILQRHLERSGRVVHTETPTGRPATRRITYTSDPAWRVAILIPTKDAVELVRQCVESLERTIRDVAYDIIVIDHASQDPKALGYFQEISPRCTILRYGGDFNFSRINNWAVEQIASEYTHYLFCNNDVEATEGGWLETMLGFTGAADVGVVGAELLYPDRSHIQHAGVGISLHGLAEHYGKFLPIRMKTLGNLNEGARIALTCPHEVSAVTAACMLVRREAFEAVDGFDEQMVVGFGDVDLCLRIGQAGYRCIYSPDSSLIHHESLTRGKDGGDPHPMDTVYFKKRWQQMLDDGDPYFHPAYSRFSFSWQYSDPLPCSQNPAARVWKRNAC
jgi:GT2 family glycosyltransferase